jgi:hypothetical protein
VIVLNGANSIISVGLQPYATQNAISITTSLIALICGIIGSIELFFGIQRRLESDMIAQRDYYLLSIDIFKTLSLAKHNRPIPAKDYLEKSYNAGLFLSSMFQCPALPLLFGVHVGTMTFCKPGPVSS